MSEDKIGCGLAIKAKKYFHPRRLWLFHYRANEIAATAYSFLPKRYDARAAYAEVRKNGGNLSASMEQTSDPNIDSIATNPTHSENAPAINQKQPWTDSAISGTEAATLYGIGTFEKFQQVDEYVYQAMSKLSGENVETVSDLHSTLGEYKHDFWGSLVDKAQDKWKGHLAEEYAGDDFTEAGNHVEWPTSSNQEGWDMLVDGHAVNVKLVADSSGLYSHFDKFPDIPVVVPHDTDLGGLTDHVFHFDPSQGLDSGISEFLASSGSHKIIVDEAMSAADISSHASDAADIAIGGSASVDGHIPWITVATAGWREGRLLIDNKTDFKSAGKNLASDVVGRGGGAFIGGKTGAFVGGSVGSIFPGAGTVIGATIGGVIGAIGGAIGGGKASTSVKRMDLENAIERTMSAQSSLKDLQEQLERTSNTEFHDAKTHQQDELNTLRQQEQEKINNATNQLKNWRVSTNRLTTKAAMEWISQAESEITQCVHALELCLKQQGFWSRWIWPSINVVALEQSTEKLNINLDRIKLFRGEMPDGEMIGMEDLFVLFGEAGTLRQQVYSHLEVIDRERLEREDNLRFAIQSSYQTLLKRRQQAFSELSAIATKITEKIKRSLLPKINEMTQHIEKIQIEKAKLGMS